MDPVTLSAISIGLQLGSTALGFAGSKEADKNAKDAAKHDAELMRRAAEVQVESIVASKDEAQAQAAQKMSDLARASAIQRGRILAGAGESGVAGGSVSQQLLASYYQEADARGRELYNLQAYKRQANRDIAAAEAGLQVNLPKYQSQAPSLEATLLSGALDALKMHMNYKTSTK